MFRIYSRASILSSSVNVAASLDVTCRVFLDVAQASEPELKLVDPTCLPGDGTEYARP
jgi:hypothetical protein